MVTVMCLLVQWGDRLRGCARRVAEPRAEPWRRGLPRGEHALREVAHRAVTAAAVEDDARGGEDERMRLGHRDGPADEFEARRGR